jgi:hypothetical protein
MNQSEKVILDIDQSPSRIIAEGKMQQTRKFRLYKNILS